MTASLGLRFISGKYQGGEFPLLPEREIVIGRASDLDMVLVEDMVSRKHAKITTQAGQVFIQDLGSTNGTFVNGEKVKKTRLKEGDRVLIGTSILKVIARTDAPTQEAERQAKQKLDQVTKQNKPETRSAMTGSLAEVPVPDLLTLFSTSKRTGVLHIRSSKGYGKIYLRTGGVFYASINDDHELGPMKAFCRMVGWEEGDFEFSTDPAETDQSFVLELEDPTEHLLMEATRQLDEFRRIEKDLPAGDVNLHIPNPLEPSLSALGPAELDVFQLVLNHSQTQRVLDKSPSTDHDTAVALLALVNQGYVAPG